MQSQPLRHTTLADIARAAGLSRAGVSYALRGHPSIPAQTVARVRQLADDLDYKPDLRIKSLMATIRRRHVSRRPEPLAFVWMRTPRQKENLAPHLLHFAETILAGARRRAGQLGCSMEEFWLDEEDMKPERLNCILRARGITGFVVSTAGSSEPLALDWDWTPFAAAIIGHTEFSPALHRAAHHHYLAVCSTLRRLKEEGWQCPAAILSRSVQDRVHNMQVAAFLANHPTPALARELVQFTLPEKFGELSPWPRDLAPDALLVGWQIDQHAADLLRAKVPSARRLVTLDWYAYGALPGVDPINDELAAKAVDLVVEQLHANALGLPKRPSTTLLEGIWREQAPVGLPAENAN